MKPLSAALAALLLSASLTLAGMAVTPECNGTGSCSYLPVPPQKVLPLNASIPYMKSIDLTRSYPNGTLEFTVGFALAGLCDPYVYWVTEPSIGILRNGTRIVMFQALAYSYECEHVGCLSLSHFIRKYVVQLPEPGTYTVYLVVNQYILDKRVLRVESRFSPLEPLKPFYDLPYWRPDPEGRPEASLRWKLDDGNLTVEITVIHGAPVLIFPLESPPPSLDAPVLPENPKIHVGRKLVEFHVVELYSYAMLTIAIAWKHTYTLSLPYEDPRGTTLVLYINGVPVDVKTIGEPMETGPSVTTTTTTPLAQPIVSTTTTTKAITTTTAKTTTTTTTPIAPVPEETMTTEARPTGTPQPIPMTAAPRRSGLEVLVPAVIVFITLILAGLIYGYKRE